MSRYAIMMDCWNIDYAQRISFRRAYKRLVEAWDEVLGDKKNLKKKKLLLNLKGIFWFCSSLFFLFPFSSSSLVARRPLLLRSGSMAGL